MELKRVKVIKLPTEDKSSISERSDGKLQYNRSPIGYSVFWMPVHLYFVTDEDIKKDDWVFEAISRTTQRVGQDMKSGEFGARKIIATTDAKLINIKASGEQYPEWDYDLPQPTQEFIEKYCGMNGIDEVLVELMDISTLPYNDPRIPIWRDSIKIDSYNEITIHSIKNSWNEEEVEQLCRNAMFTGELLGRNPMKQTPYGKGFDEISNSWIKENL